MELNKIYNESNIETLKKLDEKSIDVVLTSPFYNTNKKAGKSRTLQNTTVKEGEYNYVRYDVFVDNMTNDEYTNYTIDLFNGFDRVLKDNGVVLYNISYGADNAFGMFDTVTQIVKNTKFSIADCITWKKKNALPNSVSSNKLTRIVEFVFVFCRKDEYKTFHANKNVVSIRQNGQPQYSVYYNFIEAKNNDENCPFNKATYSTELCRKLLTMYCARGGVVYDPFMGSGTTAVACKEMGLKYIGSEISENQCKWAEERLKKTFDESEFELDFENAI